jgi:protein-tyrosine phosphatase
MYRAFLHKPTRSSILFCLLGLPVFAASSESVPGIGNFHQVNEHVYRGAQPTEEGFKYLAKIGVKTILDLRENDARTIGEKRMVAEAGMQYVNVPMTGLTPPTEQETSKVLALLEDESGGPVFVHCKEGKDRTGAVIAAYRIDHDGWDNQRALKEAMANHMSFFQLPRQSYIKSFQPRSIEARASSKPSESTSARDTLTRTTTAGESSSLSAVAAQ